MKTRPKTTIILRFLLSILIAVISACSANPAADTSLDDAQAPVPDSSTAITLYLCGDGEVKELTLECEAEENSYTSANLYPKYPNTQVEFVYALEGDIQGTSYTLGLWLASGGTTTFDASLIIRQSGDESVLASTSFTATGNNFTLYTETLEGIDPETSKGDVLVLRVFPASGDPGALIYKSTPEGNSYITIPAIK